MRLLLVEDSLRLQQLLGECVHGAGWYLDGVHTLDEARAALRGGEHDLLVLDLALPDGHGLDLLAELRGQGNTLPVLIITASGDVESRIAGLDLGADDYLAKPFHHREFLARCRALSRRSAGRAVPVLSAGALQLDPATGGLTCAGTPLAVSPRERQVLELLLREVDRVVPKRRFEASLSEYGDALTPNALELAVSRLRRRVTPALAGVEIETVRGLGYLLRVLPPA